MDNEWTRSGAFRHPPLEELPPFFRELASWGCLSELDVACTRDGFYAAGKSLADMLIGQGITTFHNDQDQERQCSKFFDDWYLYAVPGKDGFVYSLFKMREQEHNAENGEIADGDTPGVTVCFIALETGVLTACLSAPSPANRKTLNREINRVVAARGQRHSRALKAYFTRTQAEGAYLIAQWYVQFLASLAVNGTLPVPLAYGELYRKNRTGRLPRFLDENNAAAGYPVCDHETIFLRDSKNLSRWEALALLATHTADVSFPAFAAEVQYHARFLVWCAKLPIPFLGRSVYDSAIRADMTIGETELEGPAPFHNLNSKWVRRQVQCHEASQRSEVL